MQASGSFSVPQLYQRITRRLCDKRCTDENIRGQPGCPGIAPDKRSFSHLVSVEAHQWLEPILWFWRVKRLQNHQPDMSIFFVLDVKWTPGKIGNKKRQRSPCIATCKSCNYSSCWILESAAVSRLCPVEPIMKLVRFCQPAAMQWELTGATALI